LKRKILHITPHLGGGVGKAISTLVRNDKKYCHQVITLEKNINDKFYNIIKKKNKVVTTNKAKIIKKLIRDSDIIQVEFWNHPLLLKVLISLKNFKHRVIFWLHVSGEKFPKIPLKVLQNKNLDIVFSSKRSFQYHRKFNKGNFHFISSATSLSQKVIKVKNFFKCVYIGSFHKNKINKKFISLISKNLDIIGNLNMFGENELKNIFLLEIKKKKLHKKIFINGFKKDIKNILNKSSVLLYFLERDHYGTGENILIESMSLGLIPVVLNNPLEKSIIKHNMNGIVIKDTKKLRQVLYKLKYNNKFRVNLSRKCIQYANDNFNTKTQVINFCNLYDNKIKKSKYNFNFLNIFGKSPAKIFLSFFHKKKIEPKKVLFENKGSIFQFMKIFKNDLELMKIYKNITKIQNVQKYQY
jgi:glycosyltransferase involved in cell wall biosynthesis